MCDRGAELLEPALTIQELLVEQILVVIVELAEFPRVQSKFPRHLDMRMRQAMTLARLDPVLEFRWKPLVTHSGFVADSGGPPSPARKKSLDGC